MDAGRSRQALATIGNLALALLIVIASLVIFVPLSPSFPIDTLDSGWAFGLNAALAKGLVFGRDVVFTFGPYASVYTAQYHPAIDAQMLWSGCLLAIAFSTSLICLTRGVNRIIAVGLVVFLLLTPTDTRFFAIAFVSLLLVYRVALPSSHPGRIVPTTTVRVTLALLVVALSMLPLVKGTFALASGTCMALGCVLLVLRGHKAMAVGGALLFALAMQTLWIIARQPLIYLPGFFLAQAPVISGYSAAMATRGPAWQLILFVGCCLLLGLLNGRPLYLTGAAGRVLLAGASALLFLAFKEGFVRDDGHSLIAAGILGVAACCVMLLGRKGVAPLMGLVIGMTGWVLIDGSEIHPSLATLASSLEAPFITAEHGLMIRLTAPGQLKQRYANSLRAIRSEQPLPKLVGTTDIYSYGQSALLANGLDWDPRPVLQSYSAYTPSLELKDADHLTGSDAPANVLFSVQPIDNRLPALEDGASWPILLTRYDIIGFNGKLTILRRRAAPAIVSPVGDVPIVSGTFQLGEPIAFPKDTPVVWARIYIKRTLLGKLIALIFKPPHLNITYLFSGGRKQTFRYIAGMGESGFVAAPIIQSSTDFAALTLPDASNYFAARQPLFLSISANYGAGWLWRSSFGVQFFTMRIPVQPTIGRALFKPLKIEPKLATQPQTTSDCSIDSINQQPVVHRPVSVGDFLRVAGWAATSIKNGTAPDSTVITLTAPDGAVETVKAKQVVREDVNRYFHKPNMGPVGFVASVDLTSLAGNYMLGLEEFRGNKKWACKIQIPIHVRDSTVADR